MSKIGKIAISIPEKVKVILSGSIINIEGPLGKKSINIDLDIFELNINEGKEVSLKPKQNNQRTKMLLQIHDELIFETPKEEVKRISKLIIEVMSGAANSDQHSFSIPLTVDLNTGDNWGTLH